MIVVEEIWAQVRNLQPGDRLARSGRLITAVLDRDVDGYVEVEYEDGRTGYLRGTYLILRPISIR